MSHGIKQNEKRLRLPITHYPLPITHYALPITTSQIFNGVNRVCQTVIQDYYDWHICLCIFWLSKLYRQYQKIICIVWFVNFVWWSAYYYYLLLLLLPEEFSLSLQLTVLTFLLPITHYHSTFKFPAFFFIWAGLACYISKDTASPGDLRFRLQAPTYILTVAFLWAQFYIYHGTSHNFVK